MAGPPIIEIREPGKRVRRVEVHRAIEVGRECDGENLSTAPSYRRLVISQGRAAGGIVLGNNPDMVATISSAVKNRAEIQPPVITELRRGRWERLKDAGLASQAAGA
jgi:hypothetical protein